MTKLVSVGEIFLNTSVSNHTITITREVTYTHIMKYLKQRQTRYTYNTNTRFENYKHRTVDRHRLHQVDGPRVV